MAEADQNTAEIGKNAERETIHTRRNFWSLVISLSFELGASLPSPLTPLPPSPTFRPNEFLRASARLDHPVRR